MITPHNDNSLLMSLQEGGDLCKLFVLSRSLLPGSHQVVCCCRAADLRALVRMPYSRNASTVMSRCVGTPLYVPRVVVRIGRQGRGPSGRPATELRPSRGGVLDSCQPVRCCWFCLSRAADSSSSSSSSSSDSSSSAQLVAVKPRRRCPGS